MTGPQRDVFLFFLGIIALGIVLLFGGCSLQHGALRALEGVSPDEHQAQCSKLDHQQMGWTTASIVFGGLSGAGGLTSLAVSDNQIVVRVMGGMSMGVTILSGVSVYYASIYTQRYVRQCAP